MNPDQRSLLRHATRLLIYQQQTQGLPYVATITAWRAKVTLLIIKFSRSINEISGDFQDL